MRLLLIPILFALSVLLVSSALPLMDRTESRVAVIADHLIRSNDLTHPKVPKDGELVPYYAKPPLHYWTVAYSIRALGRNAWAVRLPSLIAAVAMLLLIPFFDRTRSLTAQLIAASSGMFFALGGLGLIDASLSLAIALCELGLYRAIIHDRRDKRSVCLVALGAAYACALKGPVGIAIPGMTVALLCGFTRSFEPARRVPWLSVACIYFALIISYFSYIEQNNPGFVRYFFVNENVLRFLTHNYGDRVGSGHRQIYGMSAVFAFVAFLPWAPLLLSSLLRAKPADLREVFFLSASLAPVMLFLLARNHLATYQLPAIVPATLLLASRIHHHRAVRIGATSLVACTILPLCLSHVLSTRLSSAAVFDEALDVEIQHIHFAYEAPLSAYWYSSPEIAFDVQRSPNPEKDHYSFFAMRDKHWRGFMLNYGNLCGEVSRLGKWRLAECWGE